MDYFVDQRHKWIRSEQLRQEIVGQWREFWTIENLSVIVWAWIMIGSSLILAFLW